MREVITMKKYKKSINPNKQGFTLVEVLVALFCISLTSVLITQCVVVLNTLSKPRYQSEDQIAIHQLRILLAQGMNYHIQNNALYFTYANEENRLEFHNRRFVRRKGYEIFLQDVDYVEVKEKGRCFYVAWERKKKQKEALLTCE